MCDENAFSHPSVRTPPGSARVWLCRSTAALCRAFGPRARGSARGTPGSARRAAVPLYHRLCKRGVAPSSRRAPGRRDAARPASGTLALLERSPDQHALVGVEERPRVAQRFDDALAVALEELREALAEAALVVSEERAAD